METQHAGAQIPAEDHLKFGILAARRGMSKSELLRQLIREAVIKAEKKQDGNFRKGGAAR